MNLKTQEINVRSSLKGDAWGVPRCWGGSPEAPARRASSLGLLLTTDFLRFGVHFSSSFRDLRRDSISAHLWYGLRTNLSKWETLKQSQKWKGSCQKLSNPLFLNLLFLNTKNGHAMKN